MNRSATARLGAHESWARTADRAARTAPARQGLLARFEREARERLGPGATDKQVADAAESARRAHYARMAAKSAAVRRGRGAGNRCQDGAMDEAERDDIERDALALLQCGLDGDADGAGILTGYGHFPAMVAYIITELFEAIRLGGQDPREWIAERRARLP